MKCCTLRGQTPLFLAVEHGLIENASFLLKHGASPDIQDDNQDSPLFMGKMHGISRLQYQELTLIQTLAHSFLCDVCCCLILPVCSDPLRPPGLGEAAAPAWLQRAPGGLPRPSAPPRGLTVRQDRDGKGAAGGGSEARPPQPLWPHAAGSSSSGRSPRGGADSAEER